MAFVDREINLFGFFYFIDKDFKKTLTNHIFDFTWFIVIFKQVNAVFIFDSEANYDITLLEIIAQ